MPHKRNPIGSENMTGLARVIRVVTWSAYIKTSLSGTRDISHSSALSVSSPQIKPFIDYKHSTFGEIVKRSWQSSQKMIRNIWTRLLVKSLANRLCWHWLKKAWPVSKPMTWCNQTAYSLDNQKDFKNHLEGDSEKTHHVSQEEINEKSNPQYYTKRVEMKSLRLGLGMINKNKQRKLHSLFIIFIKDLVFFSFSESIGC